MCVNAILENLRETVFRTATGRSPCGWVVQYSVSFSSRGQGSHSNTRWYQGVFKSRNSPALLRSLICRERVYNNEFGRPRSMEEQRTSQKGSSIAW